MPRYFLMPQTTAVSALFREFNKFEKVNVVHILAFGKYVFAKVPAYRQLLDIQESYRCLTLVAKFCGDSGHRC
jgi:hypothetical protein